MKIRLFFKKEEAALALRSVTLLDGERLEPLSPTLSILVSPQHIFNTDTILLAWYASPRHKDQCADLGTGCGAIPLLWHSKFQPAHIYAVELQDNAVSLARRSVCYNGLEDRITVIQGDIREAGRIGEPPFCGQMDVVSCNPPYQEWGTGLVNPDSSRRIARHTGTCSLHDVMGAAGAALKYGGKFYLCQRPQRLADVMEAMRRAKIEPKRLRFVQQRPEKAPSLFLIEGKKGAKPGLIVEPVLLIEEDTGDFSQEMRAVYGSYKDYKYREEL